MVIIERALLTVLPINALFLTTLILLVGLRSQCDCQPWCNRLPPCR
jgi:hypothetical protein